MALIVRKPWTSQPQVPVGIDWGNPICRGLLGAINAASKDATPIGSTTYSTSNKGIVHTGGSSSLLYKDTEAIGLAATIFFVGNLRYQAASTNLIAGIGNNVSGNQIFSFQGADATARPRAVIRVVNAGGISSVESNLGIASEATSIDVWIATYDGTSNLNLYRNGVADVASRLNTAASGAPTSLNNIGLGGVKRGTNGYSSTGQSQALMAAWNRVISSAEIKSISDNPWQIFAPLRRTLWDGRAVVVTIGRPGSDITTSGWIGTPDNVTKYANIDEVSASDTDYITSPRITGVVAPITFGIKDQNGNPNTLPVGTWDVSVRVNFTEGTTAPQFRITLLDSGGVSVGNSAYQLVTASYATYTLPVTTTGIAAQIRIEFP